MGVFLFILKKFTEILIDQSYFRNRIGPPIRRKLRINEFRICLGLIQNKFQAYRYSPRAFV